MVESKSSHPIEGNESNIPNYGNKGQASKTNKCRGKKPWNKPISYPESETDFQVRCTDFEGYTFDLGPRSYDKLARTMKELERYLGETYINSCQPAIMTETAATFPNP